MFGRPVRLLSVAVVAAAATLLGGNAASAGCYSCGCAPVVYTYSPCAAYARPVYVVPQGPTYTEPVPVLAPPTPAYVDPDDYPYVGPRGYWRHHRHYHGPVYRHGPRAFRPYIGPRRYLGDGPRYRLRHGGPRYAHVPTPRIKMPARVRPMMHTRPPTVRPQKNTPAPGVVTPSAPQAPKSGKKQP